MGSNKNLASTALERKDSMAISASESVIEKTEEELAKEELERKEKEEREKAEKEANEKIAAAEKAALEAALPKKKTIEIAPKLKEKFEIVNNDINKLNEEQEKNLKWF